MGSRHEAEADKHAQRLKLPSVGLNADWSVSAWHVGPSFSPNRIGGDIYILEDEEADEPTYLLVRRWYVDDGYEVGKQYLGLPEEYREWADGANDAIVELGSFSSFAQAAKAAIKLRHRLSRRGQRARRSKSVRLVQAIPKADLASAKTAAISSKLRRLPQGSEEKFAKLVVKVRSGGIDAAQQEAILSESVKLLLQGALGSHWKSFFKKHGGENLVGVNWNEFDRPWLFLPYPSVKHRKSKAEAKFQFIRLKSDLAVDIHIADRKGDYVGTIRKVVAPVAALVKGGAKTARERGMQTRMIVAGIQPHAKGLLAEYLGVDESEITPRSDGWEMTATMTPVDVLRASTVFIGFDWPKGIDVRPMFGELNRSRRS